MGSCASDSAMLKSWRKTPPPSSFLVRLSQLANDKYESKVHNWTLTLYPKGDSEAVGELSQHLHLADGEVLLKGELVFVRVDLQVLDPRGSDHLKGWTKGWIMNSTKAMGLPQSMSLDKIQGAYLDREGTLEVEIECELENSIKNHPFF